MLAHLGALSLEEPQGARGVPRSLQKGLTSARRAPSAAPAWLWGWNQGPGQAGRAVVSGVATGGAELLLRPPSCAPVPQGTPLKYEPGPAPVGAKKHDVRSIIGSPGRPFPPALPLDVMADARALERACYEESLKGRPTTVGAAGGSITRGAPVIVPELGKPRQSPLTYEDHAAPFTGHLPRGSPVTTREPTPRLQEGACSGAGPPREAASTAAVSLGWRPGDLGRVHTELRSLPLP